MELPDFQTSDRYLARTKHPCMVSTIHTSGIRDVGAAHRVRYEEDPPLKVFLRSTDCRVTEWHTKQLGDLCKPGAIASALAAGMKEFESGSDWCGYEEDGVLYDDIKQHGILPYLCINAIVLDECNDLVMFSAGTIADSNLDEHGIVIFRQGSQNWRFEYADFASEYLQAIESGTSFER